MFENDLNTNRIIEKNYKVNSMIHTQSSFAIV